MGFNTKGRKTNPPPKVEAVKGGRIWSPQQEAIFKECDDGIGNLVVRARAGTGKTTTILEALHYLDGDVLLAAFNKRIAEELNQRVDGQAHVYTLHSLGYRFLRKLKDTQVDADRGLRLAEKACRDNQRAPTKDWLFATNKSAQIVKEVAPLDWNEEIIESLIQGYGTDEGLMRDYSREHLVKIVARHLELSKELDGTCDFSDMLYLPLVHNAIYPCYDAVVVDEAQDMNAAQLLIAQRTRRRDGRVLVVGDDRQAIYGFRGADSNALDRLKKYLKANELGLTVTYRCPRKVVELAQQLVPDFTAAPEAPEGVIRRLPDNSALAKEIRPGDFVLSRTNAPLLGVVLECVRNGIRAKIEGRDIGKGLQGIILKTKAQNVDELSSLIYEWEKVMMGRAGDNEKRIQQVIDQADIIRELTEDPALKSIDDIMHKIDDLFTDDENRASRVVCSTVHKAKGLEADRVYLLTPTFKLGAYAGEESNINYVAVTRAKKELIWVGEAPARLGVPE